MIFGIGSDIAYIPRFEQLFAKHGVRFSNTILTAMEALEFEARYARHAPRGIAFLASRFAAKEAFSKACGLGLCVPMHWQAVQVITSASGQPSLLALDTMVNWLDERRLRSHLSLSDEREYAVAYVILES